MDKENLFESFWSVYPKKEDKKQARRLFEKLNTGAKKAVVMDVIRRKKHHSQWSDKIFIPSPARYLRQEKWLDDILEKKTREEFQLEAEDGTLLGRFWTMLIQFYGRSFENSYGIKMPVAWRRALRGMNEIQAAKILSMLAYETDGNWPNLPKICSFKRYAYSPPADKLLPRPDLNYTTALAAFDQMRDMGLLEKRK